MLSLVQNTQTFSLISNMSVYRKPWIGKSKVVCLKQFITMKNNDSVPLVCLQYYVAFIFIFS